MTISAIKLVNIMIASWGLGISVLCMLQVVSASYIRKGERHYFVTFFIAILLYISSHLVREIVEGSMLAGVRTVLNTMVVIELCAACFMAVMMALMVVSVTLENRHIMACRIILMSLLVIHLAIVIAGASTKSIFYIDAQNIYRRGPHYGMSNIVPLLMMVTDMALLFIYRKKTDPTLATALWLYQINPLVAMIIQSFIYGLQLIMFATVSSAAYMFFVISRSLNRAFEKRQAEKTRLEAELSVAKHIQEDTLPGIFPPFPDRTEFDIYATMKPAKEVGGDFYDFFFVDRNHLGIVMADVSGKGIPAALFMMVCKSLIENYSMTGCSPGKVLEEVNRQICTNNREDMFVTVWLGLLDVRTGKITASNAGHEYPVIKDPEGNFSELRDEHNFVVGAFTETKFREYEIQLRCGSKLFLYTDGVVEASDKEENLFTNRRMMEALNSAASGTPEQILRAVDNAVCAFTKDAPQFDDMTMLCLSYNGKN